MIVVDYIRVHQKIKDKYLIICQIRHSVSRKNRLVHDVFGGTPFTADADAAPLMKISAISIIKLQY